MNYLRGPWRVEKNGTPRKQVFAGNELVATVRCLPQQNTGDGLSPTYAKGNAHLIAAAPSMLAYILRQADSGDVEAQAIVREYRLRELIAA